MIISRSRVSIKYLCCLSSTTVGRMARDVTFGFWWRKGGWRWFDFGLCLIVLSQFVFVCVCVFVRVFLYFCIFYCDIWILMKKTRMMMIRYWSLPGCLVTVRICIFLFCIFYLPCSLSTFYIFIWILYLHIYLWICICVFVVWYFPGSLAAFYIFICIFVNLYLYLPCSLSTVCKEQWRSQSFPHRHCSGPVGLSSILLLFDH